MELKTLERIAEANEELVAQVALLTEEVKILKEILQNVSHGRDVLFVRNV